MVQRCKRPFSIEGFEWAVNQVQFDGQVRKGPITRRETLSDPPKCNLQSRLDFVRTDPSAFTGAAPRQKLRIGIDFGYKRMHLIGRMHHQSGAFDMNHWMGGELDEERSKSEWGAAEATIALSVNGRAQ